MTAPAQAERNPPAGACSTKDELLEQAAAPALPTVRAGTAPVILMNEALRRLGEGRCGVSPDPVSLNVARARSPRPGPWPVDAPVVEPAARPKIRKRCRLAPGRHPECGCCRLGGVALQQAFVCSLYM